MSVPLETPPEPLLGRVGRVKAAAVAPPAAPTVGFAPWSLPAAFCLLLGILLASLHWPAWTSLLGLLAVTALRRLHTRAFWLLALSALLVPVGYARYHLWASATNPLQEQLGKEGMFTGVSDGRFLTLTAPHTRVALVPAGKVGEGRVELRGVLETPPGKRNPGGFDSRGYLRRRGVWAQLYVKEVVSFAPAAPSLKTRLQQGVTAGLEGRSGALLQAMTLGVRDGLGDLREVFAASGLAHLLALSGLHVGILMTALGVLLKPLGRHRYPLMMVLVVGFVALVGVSPSILRAGVMTVVVLLSLWSGSGRIEAWPALALAALVTLLYNPAWLFELSFQLSYLAVMGILVFAAPTMRLLFGSSRLPWWDPRVLVVGAVVVSTAAQVFSLPLVLGNFYSLPLLSPLTNVLAIPLATLLVPLGFVAGLAGLVSLPLAAGVNTLTGVVAGALIRLADAAATGPALPWGDIAPVGYGFYAVAALALALMAQRKLRPWRAGTLVVVAACGSMLVSLPGRHHEEIIYFDVGQGDSSLIRLPGGVEILMDGGGTPFSDYDIGKHVVVPALRALGVTALELVIASHPDTDHIEGLVSVLDSIPVQQLVIGVPKPGDAMFDALMAAATRNRVPVTQVTRGESLSLVGARLDILNPPVHPYDEDNDNSVAFVLNVQGRARAIFLGDISSAVEAQIAFPKVDILMAAHHGSRHSTSEGLLRAAWPKDAVLSYGRNNYGHPSPEVTGRLQAYGVRVHETYKTGAVRLPLGP